ncbi:Peptidase M15 [Prevotella sp. tc2-28]|nr:Peptidase M15 [Prevotella sp. tc2-28]
MKLSEHFTLRELTKTNTGIANVPNEAQVENLRRVCRWLERLRKRWNDKYGDGDDPIIINSGFRSPEVNKAVGGVPTSNHLTGCAVDIRCIGMEQALRYAAILLDISDMSREDFDELLIEQKRSVIWIHFAVRPSGNRRRTSLRLRSLLQRS